MDKMIPEINRAIERKYQDIKETGKIYSGIKSLYETIAWEDPQLASYVRQKMPCSGSRRPADHCRKFYKR